MSNIKSITVNGQTYEIDSSSSSELPIVSYNKGDFGISDENGNVLVNFKDGHIKTKNFDSETIEPSSFCSLFTDKFKNKTIGIVGDSISTFGGWLPSDIAGYTGSTYAKYYPSGTLTSVTMCWWYKMALALGLNPQTQISNCAWSGSEVAGDSTSTTNAYAACSDRRISDLTLRLVGRAPDIIICYISCNDWGNKNRAIGTWKITDPIPAEGTINTLREAYALMLYKLHNTYPDARIFCCTNLDDTARDRTNGWPSNNSSGVSTYEWNQNIREVANAMGCDIIELHQCGMNYTNMRKYCVDSGLHPNDAGHTLMARKIVAELFAKY